MRWQTITFSLITLAVLGLAAWSGTATRAAFPYVGVEILGTGIAYEVDPHGPAAGAGLQEGDRIHAIDGVPFHWRSTLHGRRIRGDSIDVTVKRAEEIFTSKVELAETPRLETIFNLERLFVGLTLWLVGTLIWMLHPTDAAARVFFLMAQLVAAVAFGEILDPAIPAMTTFTDLARFFVAPAVLHAFALFPPPLSEKKRRVLVRVAYALALVSVVLFFGSLASPFDIQLWRVFEVGVLTAALAVLFRPQPDADFRTRRRRRLMVAGVVAGLGPVLLLTLLGYAVRGRPFVPWEWTLPTLAIAPMMYGYAVYKGELGKADLILNRGVVYLLLASVPLGLYALIYLRMQSAFSAHTLAIAGVVLIVVGSVLFVPLRNRLQQLVDRLFYGGWYDYRSMVQSVSLELGRTVSLDDFILRLRAVGEKMRFNSGVLLWPRDASYAPRAAYGVQKKHFAQLKLPMHGNLARVLSMQPGLWAAAELRDAVSGDEVVGEERAALQLPGIRYWLPLTSHGRLQSILMLGQRQADEPLDREDRAILMTLSTQAAFACENIQLLESLRTRLAEVERMRDELAETQAQLSEGREAERLHLARELHDGPVQDLYALLHEAEVDTRVGMKGASSNGRSHLLETALTVAARLRDICTELRPPFLSELGLEVAIRSHLRSVQLKHPHLEVIVEMPPHPEVLSERNQLALFRICQESANNAVQHGAATMLRVRFEADAEGAILEVSDNGSGFHIPPRWIEFGRRGHLGLLGMAERMEAIGGNLRVHSAIGIGTSVRATAPHTGRNEQPMRPRTHHPQEG